MLDSPLLIVRPMSKQDIPGAVALQRSCFPEPFPAELLWSDHHLERHLEIFPEGQFVALYGGLVIGSASALLISEESWLAHHDWETTTGGHFLSAHDPNGSTLYAADISVHPEHRGQGVGRMLYEARFELVRRFAIERLGTACRIPDFAAWHAKVGGTVEDYAFAVAQNEIRDRTLTPLLRYGLKLLGILEDYLDDEESANAAALLEWKP